jgi:hypothetical protein
MVSLHNRLTTETDFLFGVLNGMLIVVYTRLVWRAETTFSFLMVLALEFEKIVYSDVAC